MNPLALHFNLIGHPPPIRHSQFQIHNSSPLLNPLKHDEKKRFLPLLYRLADSRLSIHKSPSAGLEFRSKFALSSRFPSTPATIAGSARSRNALLTTDPLYLNPKSPASSIGLRSYGLLVFLLHSLAMKENKPQSN